MAPEKPRELAVANWRKFQHYADRNPPWIKLHFEILSSDTWLCLRDASKLLAIVCMLIASRRGGLVPDDPERVKKLGNLNELPDLTPLLEDGFLVPATDASTVLASKKEKERERESESEVDKRENRAREIKKNGGLTERQVEVLGTAARERDFLFAEVLELMGVAAPTSREYPQILEFIKNRLPSREDYKRRHRAEEVQ